MTGPGREPADRWRDGPWGHLLANVDIGDALGLLVQLARDDDAIEELLEAVLANPVLVGEFAGLSAQRHEILLIEGGMSLR